MHLIWQPPWLSKRADFAGFDRSSIWEVFEATKGFCVDNVNQETGGKFFENERPCSHVTLILQEVPGGCLEGIYTSSAERSFVWFLKSAYEVCRD
jgi:hypothetical protein